MIVMITKDNQMTNYYGTFQTFRRKNANFVASTQKYSRDQSSDDELLLSRNIDFSQRTSVIFKAKLILLYEIIFDEALDIMRSVEDEYKLCQDEDRLRDHLKLNRRRYIQCKALLRDIS